MKVHTNNFKSKIKDFGRELDSKIIYTINGVTTELGSSQLNSVTPHYEANLLKSVMKQLDIDSNVDIPIGTEINYQFGLKVGNSYEYLDYGNYIIYSSEKQEDSRSWKLIAYDKMLNAMKDYENLNITYPITVRNYIIAICNKIGLTFKNANEDFANYDKNILEELYLDADGNTLGYTYRDVLDELAQVTASVICIDKNDNLEIRYINELVNEKTTKTGNPISIENARNRELEDFTLLGNIAQNGTPTPSTPVPVDTVTGGQIVTVCRKNLLNIDNWVKGRINNTTGNIEYASNVSSMTIGENDIKFIVSQVWNSGIASDFIPISTGNYVFKYSHNREITMYIDAYDNQKSRISRIGTYTQSSTPTTYTFAISDSNVKYIRIHFEVNTANVEYIVSEMQLEKGSTATTYEPYTGNNYEINLGKNLFDISQAQIGTAWNNSSNSARAVCYIKCEPSTKYTISFGSLSSVDAIYSFEKVSTTSTTATSSVSQITATKTITTQATSQYLGIQFNKTNITQEDVESCNIQIEKGSQATSYSAYKIPIERCKIGSNKDKIFKGKGVNLFDYSYSNLANTTRATVSEENNGFKVTSTGVIGFGYSSLQLDNSLLGKQITISMNSSGDKTPSGRLFYVNTNGTLGTNVGAFWTTNNSHTETLPSTLPDGTKAIALVLYISQSTNSSGNYAIFRNIQVQLGNTATEYEPFNSKDKWLLRKEIGKVVFTGASDETWTPNTNWDTNYTQVLHVFHNMDNWKLGQSNYLSNYFKGTNETGRDFTKEMMTCHSSNASLYAFINYSNLSGVSSSSTQAQKSTAFKNWLSTHPTSVYYILATPTTTEITDTELINQLDSLKLMYGRNEISLNSNGTLSFKYISEYETIDENYLKDINVNFGENFGPINSIVLTRAGGSDSVYINNESSINNYGLHEIKIEDNQIMNLNNRADFLPDLLKYLDGIEYFYNDFSSTGICYLDLLDLYTVKIDNNYYNCLMLNDEADITQGLEEQIHTDIAEETETDYQYASKDDRQRTMAYIIAKKNEGEIEALASKVVDLSNTINGIGSITLENAYEGTLHRLEISGSILLIYPSDTLHPSETLTILDTNLLVDTNKYHLDIDRLNYISATEHDTYIYEDGKNWIERANGTIEQKEDFTIEVTENSAISLEQFPNAIFKCIYLLQNDYTNTFTNSLDIVSKINLSPEKIEINSNKISLAGKTIDLTSELININSKYFKVDSEGNLTATSATLNGRFENYSPNGKLAISINRTLLKFYDYKGTEAQVGGIGSTRGNQDNVTGISLFTIQGSRLILGYKEQEDNSTVKSIINYDTNDLTKTPWIINTVGGTMFPNCGDGVVIQNGLIKHWSLPTKTGDITINEPNNHSTTITVKNGLITNWEYE